MKPVKEKTKMKKLLIIFAVLCLAAPAMAADWNFYGNFRMATWYQDDDYDTNRTLTPDPDDPTVTLGPYSDDKDVQWQNGGNSRIGANVSVNDQIGGGFELGFDTAKAANNPYARKIFGTYTFGNGSRLLIGKNYTPSALFYSNSVFGGDGDLLGLGEYYRNRQDQISWKMGGFEIALIEPTPQAAATTDVKTIGATAVPGNSINNTFAPVTNTTLPQIEAAYKFKGDAFFLDIIGAYQTYELDGATLGTEDVDSYIGILGGGVNFGAFFAKAQAHLGQNVGNLGASGPYSTGPTQSATKGAAIDSTAWTVVDNENVGGLLVLGFNASEMLTFEAGVGYESYELDVANAPKEALMQYYLNCTVNIAPGFFIVPEVGMVNYDPDVANAPEPERFYLGAKWQINF
jgi:hypothetical protein